MLFDGAGPYVIVKRRRRFGIVTWSVDVRTFEAKAASGDRRAALDVSSDLLHGLLCETHRIWTLVGR